MEIVRRSMLFNSLEQEQMVGVGVFYERKFNRFD